MWMSLKLTNSNLKLYKYWQKASKVIVKKYKESLHSRFLLRNIGWKPPQKLDTLKIYNGSLHLKSIDGSIKRNFKCNVLVTF